MLVHQHNYLNISHILSASSASNLSIHCWFTNGRGTVSQEGYRQALVVMQQLKERNDSLREKNAELVEEMFVPEAWLR